MPSGLDARTGFRQRAEVAGRIIHEYKWHIDVCSGVHGSIQLQYIQWLTVRTNSSLHPRTFREISRAVKVRVRAYIQA